MFYEKSDIFSSKRPHLFLAVFTFGVAIFTRVFPAFAEEDDFSISMIFGCLRRKNLSHIPLYSLTRIYPLFPFQKKYRPSLPILFFYLVGQRIVSSHSHEDPDSTNFDVTRSMVFSKEELGRADIEITVTNKGLNMATDLKIEDYFSGAEQKFFFDFPTSCTDFFFAKAHLLFFPCFRSDKRFIFITLFSYFL